MKLNELNANQKVGFDVLNAIQKKIKYRFNKMSDVKLNLAYQASMISSDYEDIAVKVTYLSNTMDLSSALRKYIERHGEIEVKENPEPLPPLTTEQAELPIQETKIEKVVKVEKKSELPPPNVGSLERALSDLMLNAQSVQIKNEIAQQTESLKAELAQSADTLKNDIQAKTDSIRQDVLSCFPDVAKKYLDENYGFITRKIEVQVGETKAQFNEILHEKFETVVKLIKLGKAPYLTGEAGTGKNVICKQVAKALGLPFYFSNAVTQEYKLTGFTDANGTFHETQFYKAFKNGGVFMLDEMDASIPEALLILNAALANGYFDFPAPIGYVEAHKDFHVISAGNTFGLGADYQYSGRNQLDMATLDRFIPVEIKYDKNIEKSIANGDDELVAFAEELRNQIKKTGTNLLITYRAIKNIADLVGNFELPEIMKMCVVKNLQEDDVRSLIDGMDKSNKYVKAMYDLYK